MSAAMERFARRHGLWSAERAAAAKEITDLAASAGLNMIRLSCADQHGLLRGKTIMAAQLADAFESGIGAPSSLLAKDTAHRTVFPVFSEGAGLGMAQMQGAADMLLLPDPSTFRILPWAEKTGWLLCDLYFGDGRPVAFSTRGLLAGAVSQAAAKGFDYIAGVELEFHLFKLKDERLALEDSGQPGAPPEVELTSRGYRLLTEEQFDRLEPVLDGFRIGLQALGLPLRSLEVEFGPSQCELTLAPLDGVAAADAVVLLRSAVRQMAQRIGYHVTFMCRPRIPNVMSSGWHLHQSLRARKSGANAFQAAGEGELLSAEGRGFLGGLLAHARDGALFAAPTVNAYRRYRPGSLAPDRANWGVDNRGAMIRVIGGRGDPATHLENRVGEPAANPYLYMAAQLQAGLDGIASGAQAGAPTTEPYQSDAPRLPRSLAEAVSAAKDSAFYRRAFGGDFIDYYAFIKEAELARFEAEVSDWEHREYFDTF
ncbi:MAG: glutamine synthetase family protein [Hyphomonadaceae bacterium]